MKIPTSSNQSSTPYLDAVFLVTLKPASLAVSGEPAAQTIPVEKPISDRNRSANAQDIPHVLQFDALWGADGSIRIVDEDARLGANASYDTFMEGLSRELPKGVTVEKIDIALEQDFDTTGTPSRSWSVSANSNEFGVHTDPSVIQGLMREKGRVPKVHHP